MFNEFANLPWIGDWWCNFICGKFDIQSFKAFYWYHNPIMQSSSIALSYLVNLSWFNFFQSFKAFYWYHNPIMPNAEWVCVCKFRFYDTHQKRFIIFVPGNHPRSQTCPRSWLSRQSTCPCSRAPGWGAYRAWATGISTIVDLFCCNCSKQLLL